MNDSSSPYRTSTPCQGCVERDKLLNNLREQFDIVQKKLSKAVSDAGTYRFWGIVVASIGMSFGTIAVVSTRETEQLPCVDELHIVAIQRIEHKSEVVKCNADSIMSTEEVTNLHVRVRCTCVRPSE
jgi:hypothetical protein